MRRSATLKPNLGFLISLSAFLLSGFFSFWHFLSLNDKKASHREKGGEKKENLISEYTERKDTSGTNPDTQINRRGGALMKTAKSPPGESPVWIPRGTCSMWDHLSLVSGSPFPSALPNLVSDTVLGLHTSFNPIQSSVSTPQKKSV